MKRLDLMLGAFLIASGGSAADEPEPAAAPAFTIPWSTVDAGGGVSVLGRYRLVGSTGQPNGLPLTDGTSTITSGFWVIGSGNPIFSDDFESGGLEAWSLHVP